MSKQTGLAIPIDPEYAKIYEEAARAESVSGQPESATNPADSVVPPRPASTSSASDERFEALEKIAKLAKENQANSIDRRTLPAGSFDQIENDVSNTLRLGWNILTS